MTSCLGCPILGELRGLSARPRNPQAHQDQKGHPTSGFKCYYLQVLENQPVIYQNIISLNSLRSLIHIQLSNHLTL